MQGITNLIGEIKLVIAGGVIPVLIGIALLIFFWGIVKFVFSQGSEKAQTDGKKIMIWGLIALFVMLSVWGIIKFFQDAFGLSNLGPPAFPNL